MTWSKPISEVELAYIEKSWPNLSCAEIAEKLGRSKRGVENAVNRLDLRASCARADTADETTPEPPSPTWGKVVVDDGREQDELAELRELKRMLKRTMRQEAGPQSMPKLSAEFREVVARISELEGGGNAGKPAGDALASLIGFMPIRPA